DSARYSRRIPVNCIINMRGDLATPNINFDIKLPTADSETQARLENLINTEEKRNKQFLSLLLINSFYPETNTIGYASSSNQIGSTGINTTASDLLSNQLSLWLSQLSKDFDIGVNYRPGDEISKDEVEVALSTQLLNDRVTISGNVDYGGNKINNQAITGEFNIEVKANKKGSVKFKGFNRANDQMLYQTSPNTQGVGISYTEDFNTFGELWRKYKSNIVNLFTSKKKKQLNQQKDSVSVSEIKNDE
ncbi:MAG: translocation/assembly module TamB domain-containing protein, partial [Bacteroidales bacterium]|nr:translocation/assembly module TamB domain-containing protein [Bacteroidales bacterium]